MAEASSGGLRSVLVNCIVHMTVVRMKNLGPHSRGSILAATPQIRLATVLQGGGVGCPAPFDRS